MNLPKKNNQEWGARHIVRVGRGEDSKRFPKVRYWHLHIGHTPLLTSGRKQELRRNVENLKKSNYLTGGKYRKSFGHVLSTETIRLMVVCPSDGWCKIISFWWILYTFNSEHWIEKSIEQMCFRVCYDLRNLHHL